MPEAVVAPQPVPKVQGRFELPVEVDVPREVDLVPEAPAKAETPNTGEPATPPVSDGEPPKETPEVTPEQAAKREQRRAQNRLEKAYRQRAEALAKAELLEKQLNEAKAVPTPPVAGEPTLAQFDYDPEKYATAKADFAKAQAAKDIEAKQRQESAQQERQRLITAWDAKVDRAAEKYDDFDTVVGELKPTAPFVAALMEADNGEDIAYHLGKHPKEAQRIAALSPLSQVREIGKLEAKLALEAEKPKKEPSKAPAPIAPLTGTAAVNTDVLSETDDMRTWMRKRQKQVHAR